MLLPTTTLRRCLLALAALPATALCTPPEMPKPWDRIHDTPLAVAARGFAEPPADYANHVIWAWGAQVNEQTIPIDLDAMQAKGFHAVIIEAGYRMPFDYLSEGWFKAIALAVKEAKKRGMRVWIIDEGKYPSGFAGGKFTRERPDLRMQGLVRCEPIEVKAGKPLKGAKLDPRAISAVAVNESGQPPRAVAIHDHRVDFDPGARAWTLVSVRPGFQTSPTRSVTNANGEKDATNSLCDFLNPAAVRQFIDWTHEQYKHAIGDEFGKTVLGFRGDEPDFWNIVPWTPGMVATFQQRKGYDPTPWLATLLAPPTGEREKRFRADYWDVWSGLFAEHFFKQQADWCAANGLAYVVHINCEDRMPVCVRSEGDFFRDLSHVQIPGVDTIRNQIWPGTVADFPKLASSVAHVFGRPRVFSESFAAYQEPMTLPQAKWVVDHQLARGINFFEFMLWRSGGKGPTRWMQDPGMKDLNAYTARATWLLTLGRPGARVAVYHPTSTMWLGDDSVDAPLNTLADTLLRRQCDFDFVSEDAFARALTVGQGSLENQSGQSYTTLVIPSIDVISETAWTKIRAFAASGGRLLFWGRKPRLLSGKTFADATPFPDDVTAAWEPTAHWTPVVAAAMPVPEVKFEGSGLDAIRYQRRILPDAEIVFLFNQGDSPAKLIVTPTATGSVQSWDATTGTITDLPAEPVKGKPVLHLDLPGGATRFLTIAK
ncbi:glycosyl hydrolase [Luteolibacter sp. LG18]|uniref:glycosyl hydrolase n=1 Tax=Luteolibacter sp. LG18 TaxID=2819286 RepID=UPI002B2A4922|nr:hypothetical protein llg_25820 [Luteolibacter sp. LG18]